MIDYFQIKYNRIILETHRVDKYYFFMMMVAVGCSHTNDKVCKLELKHSIVDKAIHQWQPRMRARKEQHCER